MNDEYNKLKTKVAELENNYEIMHIKLLSHEDYMSNFLGLSNKYVGKMSDKLIGETRVKFAELYEDAAIGLKKEYSQLSEKIKELISEEKKTHVLEMIIKDNEEIILNKIKSHIEGRLETFLENIFTGIDLHRRCSRDRD